MLNAISGIIYTAVLAVVFAYWEVQIEGQHGHAAKLPCWRKEDGWIVKKIFGGTPITGYHIGMNLFLILAFHFVFIFTDWTFLKEVLIAGLIFEFLILEDFSWFLINPHYGFKRFKKEHIHWHRRWMGPVPSSYVYFGILAVILLTLGSQSLYL
ncbi:MAG: hypothetical protein HYW70_01150 [Candidatus Nealsonbacteria bacterium]|nr:hypothetical protein [Candidatus Nealsonbacteria bacterium]